VKVGSRHALIWEEKKRNQFFFSNKKTLISLLTLATDDIIASGLVGKSDDARSQTSGITRLFALKLLLAN
jgi:hypothetical protein